MAHIVAVQKEGVVTALEQGHIQRIGNGGLTGPTQAGKPQQARALVLDGSPVRPGDFLVVPNDIFRHEQQPSFWNFVFLFCRSVTAFKVSTKICMQLLEAFGG